MKKYVCQTIDRDDAKRAFDSLFLSIHAEHVSLRERGRRGLHDQSYVYGDVTFDGFVDLLDSLQVKAGSTFLDLGCGVGKPMVCAYLTQPFSHVYGIEILSDIAKIARGSFLALTKSLQRIEVLSKQTYYVDTGDMFSCILPPADVIFLAATCFSKKQLSVLSSRLANCKPGTQLITLTQRLENPHIKLMNQKKIECGWGSSIAYIYTVA